MNSNQEYIELYKARKERLEAEIDALDYWIMELKKREKSTNTRKQAAKGYKANLVSKQRTSTKEKRAPSWPERAHLSDLRTLLS